ncbi:MAG: flippase-like domain-containing protein [Acidobacteria bacterium]|nr:flippase-like domain-containing protein [Acidobacteriota bacterium]
MIARSLLIRLAVATGLTAIIVWMADPRAIGAALAGVSWGWLAAACALVLVDRAVMAYRWWALLTPLAQHRPRLAPVMRIFFVSTFVGTFLPASVGGDAVRAWSLSRENVPGPAAVASVVLDRMLGVAGVLLVAAAGLALAPRLAGSTAVRAAFVVTALGCLLCLAVIFSERVDDVVRRSLARAPGRLGALAANGLSGLQLYRTEHRQLLLVLIASVAVQALRILQAWFLGLSLGVAAPLTAYIAFVPVILLVMLLPVTVNGLGTAQVAFVWAFAQVGVSSADAVALSVLFVGLGIVGNLPGGVLYLSAARTRRPSPMHQ